MLEVRVNSETTELQRRGTKSPDKTGHRATTSLIFKLMSRGARDGNRTHMLVKLRILSPLRLPISSPGLRVTVAHFTRAK